MLTSHTLPLLLHLSVPPSHTLPLFLHLSVPPSELYQMSVPESAQAGSAVGRIQAKDRDEGVNAEMTYRIIDGDGRDTFKISNDPTNMFGIITIKKVPANTVSIED